MKAVITGAAGFIGHHLYTSLVAGGWDCVSLGRAQIGDLATADERLLRDAMSGSDVVYHLAGRAHRADRGRDVGQRDAYHRDNVVATERVYEAARRSGATRFVHLSTIKVLGETAAQPLAVDADLAPSDVYSESKADAERALIATAGAGVPVTIVRPPLVFGPGVGANFSRLVTLVRRGYPLPVGAARAPRSLIYVRNLCDLLGCIAEDKQRLRIVHARDCDVDVASLVGLLAEALGVRSRMVRVPATLIRLALAGVGAGNVYTSLFEPLLVDDSATRCAFAWTPPVDLRTAIAATVAEGVS